ncbi:MAG: EamA family transporter [Firmicutes bacterium]|nr:EamA family transporter [Bacillota bacterium]MBQ4181604.1 EamA family transporter [Bacillota bacterium]MBQ5437851.1 EamA family transporter [Bacillota bacterium]MBQ6012965.1 EamA family transporter [Bacillota bacterium]MBQ6260709.1 EamA family transporter [Bacillota bacterium]
MIYLILSILCSTLMSVLMRWFEDRISERMVMFITNYFVCIGLARWYMGAQPLFPDSGSLGFTLLCGFISGVFFLVSLAISQWNFATSGIILSSTFSKLGVLVPTSMAVIVFGERPGILQILGFALAIASIFLINSDGGRGNLTELGKTKDPKLLKLMLFANLFASGMTSAMSNIFDKMGEGSMKDHFLFYNFCFAMLSTLAVLVVKRTPVKLYDVIAGVIIGVPNYYSARFMLYSLTTVPATVAFPVNCIGTMLALFIAGSLLFGERLSQKKKIAVAVITVALVLLNLK